MDAAIQRVSIAESARIAAQLAADTLEHTPNPHEPGTDDHAVFAAAYARYFSEFTTGVASA